MGQDDLESRWRDFFEQHQMCDTGARIQFAVAAFHALIYGTLTPWINSIAKFAVRAHAATNFDLAHAHECVTNCDCSALLTAQSRHDGFHCIAIGLFTSYRSQAAGDLVMADSNIRRVCTTTNLVHPLMQGSLSRICLARTEHVPTCVDGRTRCAHPSSKCITVPFETGAGRA